jgi:hypothetical protein
MRLSPALLPSTLALLWIAGCAHAPAGRNEDPQVLLGHACEPGSEVAGVKGSVWLKAKSREASGQFPAVVEAAGRDKLTMEVTNLVGGTEATIRVVGGKYSVEIPKKKGAKGQGSWGGIPLHWATDLFLGRIPCPPESSLADARKRVSEDGELTVETAGALGKEPEVFAYRFRKWEGRPWPESLRWERKGTTPLTVEFRFDDPEDGTHSPRKWEARSQRGEVKVRWKDREVSRTSEARR